MTLQRTKTRGALQRNKDYGVDRYIAAPILTPSSLSAIRDFMRCLETVKTPASYRWVAAVLVLVVGFSRSRL